MPVEVFNTNAPLFGNIDVREVKTEDSSSVKDKTDPLRYLEDGKMINESGVASRELAKAKAEEEENKAQEKYESKSEQRAEKVADLKGTYDEHHPRECREQDKRPANRNNAGVEQVTEKY